MPRGPGYFNAVLHDYLGSFTSRNTQHDGYWLMGFLAADPRRLEWDLLVPLSPQQSASPVIHAHELAVSIFAAQLSKAGGAADVCSAFLAIHLLPDAVVMDVNGHERWGCWLRYAVTVIDWSGSRYLRSITVAVAPHDPSIERRSLRQWVNKGEGGLQADG